MGIFDFLRGDKNNEEVILNAKKQGAILIDVRTREEYRKGYVDGSKNIPLALLRDNLNEIKKMKQPLLVCCASGVRSGQAKVLLKKEGISCINIGSWRNY